MSALTALLRRTRFADSRLGVAVMGHRAFIGGLWDEVAQLQYQLMVDEGLEPGDTLLDVGCGSLRGGRLFIPYLDPGHYIGVEQYSELVRRGLAAEVPPEVQEEKRPQFVYTDSFEFPEFSPRPTFALAQSLFSHLNRADAELCLRQVRERVDAGCRFLVTFLESDAPVDMGRSHTHRRLFFTRDEMDEMGSLTGWDCDYIGDWDHPRAQRLVRYTAV